MYDLFSLRAFLLRSIATPVGFHFSRTEQHVSALAMRDTHADKAFEDMAVTLNFNFCTLPLFSYPLSSSFCAIY